MRFWGFLLVACVLPATAQAQTAAAPVLIDGFEDLSTWQASASDQVKLSLRAAPGVRGKALCLAYDFNGVAGYAVARRALPLQLPENYVFDLRVRGDAPANQFQIKFVDASGDNVWWMNRSDFTPPHEWQQLKVRRRQIDFAWGPTEDK
ncbi:hypothetical protein, partial [Aquabacterium sp.]|uniref:hypothetical protein n=1 Tax=Aquabacterium sp. TaxID=1872578 RepID=UPI002CBAB180